MKKVEVLAIVKEEIRIISQVFEMHCKDDVTKKQLKTYLDYATGKLTACINIWVSLEIAYLTESGKHEECKERAMEIREREKEIEGGIKAMYYKKLDEIEDNNGFKFDEE